ncbi:phosphatase PAP2 family protein [Arthrobacter sp. H14-L1]|uniref:phosphatase PAP2 family protein n=1 Tax=Arthrobacter sp. H14-L1 TaxID=2996697 RepID=UPI00226FA448|nr:phosphatase PAP2 family protein [Arthrobacter sp. H14-L1]MCY0906145.1 phosphatase PAP2 family protein [Arthrobacter sp. H14-L1]
MITAPLGPQSGLRQRAPLPFLRSLWWIALAAAVFAAAVAVGLMVKGAGAMTPELGVDVALSQERNPVLTGMSLAINTGLGPAGAVIILLLVCLFLLVIRRNLMRALAFGSVVSVGWLSSEVGKRLVERIRPPDGAVHALISERGTDSFPSGHTAFAVALVWAVVLVIGSTASRQGLLLGIGAVFVALVAFSRLYLGVHYLSDVLGSVFIASAAILAWLPIWNNLLAPRFTTPRAGAQRVSMDSDPIHPPAP